MKSIPLHLITGYLGSGKTSFLKNFIRKQADAYRIAVIQNEFSEVNIDAKELRSEKLNIEILEINKGSVFCVCLFSGFANQLKSFVEVHKPDIILLEATGLANPVSIGQLMCDESISGLVYLARIWTIIDALHFSKVKQLSAVINQIAIADEVIINKIDLVTEIERREISKAIQQINPLAKIQFANYCNIEMESSLFEKTLKMIVGEKTLKSVPVFTQVFTSPYPVKRKNLDYLLNKLSEDVLRIKGYILLDDGKNYMLQSVFGSTTLVVSENKNEKTELVCITKVKIDFETILRKLVLI
jgi:G3E family GTPase